MWKLPIRSQCLLLASIAVLTAGETARAASAPAVDLMSCSKKNGEVAMKLENVPVEGFFCSSFQSDTLKQFRASVKQAFQGIEYNGKRPREVKVEAAQTYAECLDRGPRKNSCSASASREDCCLNLYKSARVKATWRGRRGTKRVLTFLNGNVEFFEQKPGHRAQTYVCTPPKDAELSLSSARVEFSSENP